MSRNTILTGLDVLVEHDFAPLRGRRVGLLCHPASVDGRLRHAATLLRAAPGADLRCLFGPQHGLRGETQDNMVEWRGFADPATGLPAYSLYGEHRKPTAAMLADLDLLVIDLQDVGARYYTFIWTMLLCLEACAEQGKAVLVLDRPNPLGDAREGNVLDPAYRSFVGLEPLPMRHGLTIGELARLFRRRRGLDVDLTVIGCRGLDPGAWFDETGLPWVLPSPNMPTLDTAAVYPGMCLLEGTELSEGRGTTRPFEIFGAPWIEPERYAARLAGYDGIVIGSAIHYGHHAKPIRELVRSHRAILRTRHTAFFSVSLSAGGPHRDGAAAKRYLEEFTTETGWKPDLATSFAGAIRHSRYGLLKTLLVHLSLRKTGTPEAGDHEYTDWKAVAEFAAAFARRLATPARSS